MEGGARGGLAPSTMHRRKLLQTALAIAGAVLLTGHSPYRQWYVFRAKHWFVVAARVDPQASRLADLVCAQLASRVPESQAMAAETETERDAVQLLRTHQLQMAIVTTAGASDAVQGSGAFRTEGSVPLRALRSFGSHLLVTLEDFPDDRAAQIAAALDDLPRQDGDAPVDASATGSPVPLHSGVSRPPQAQDPKTGE